MTIDQLSDYQLGIYMGFMTGLVGFATVTFAGGIALSLGLSSYLTYAFGLSVGMVVTIIGRRLTRKIGGRS